MHQMNNMSIENINPQEQKNNQLEKNKEKKPLDVAALEYRLKKDMEVDDNTVKQVESLGGTKEVLMSKLAGVKEKMKWVGEKIRSNARKLVLFTGLGLSIAGVNKLATNKEHHQMLIKENSNELIAKERAGAYVKGKSEWLAEHVEPFGYSVLHGGEEGTFGTNQNEKAREQEHAKDRFDAWYLYLGLEQKEGTFEVSPYKPAHAENPNAVYYRMPKKEGFLLRNGLMVLTAKGKDKETLTDFGKARPYSYVSDEEVKKVKDSDVLDAGSDLSEKYHLQPIIDSIAQFTPDDYYGVMGRYVVSKGVDEKGSYISYYDKWDLHPGGVFGKKEASEYAGVGKPFEIYGRIYYDPKTGEPITESK